MVEFDPALLRARAQRLAGPRPRSPSAVVRWMGAVQAQDRPAALWAIGLRTRSARATDVERAVARRQIVRTWPLRNTLHIVPAERVRTLLAVLGKRAVRAMDGRRKGLGLTTSIMARARSTLRRALDRDHLLARSRAYEVLAKAGISTSGQRGIHILCQLSQEGLICHGPIQGKEASFVLLDDWVPAARASEVDPMPWLAARYFASHGPARDADFAWWAGIPLGQARKLRDVVGPPERGEDTWGGPARADGPSEVHLLPSFDEFVVAYKERSVPLGGVPAVHRTPNLGLLTPVIVADGRVVGRWSRSFVGGGVQVGRTFFRKEPSHVVEGADAAAERFARFWGRDLVA